MGKEFERWWARIFPAALASPPSRFHPGCQYQPPSKTPARCCCGSWSVSDNRSSSLLPRPSPPHPDCSFFLSDPPPQHQHCFSFQHCPLGRFRQNFCKFGFKKIFKQISGKSLSLIWNDRFCLPNNAFCQCLVCS